MDEIEVIIAEARKQLEELKKALEDTNGAVTHLEKAADALDKLAGIATKTIGNAERLNASIKEALKALEEAVKRVGSMDVGRLTTLLEELGDRVGRLESELLGRLEQQDKKLDAVHAQVKQLETQARDNLAELSEMKRAAGAAAKLSLTTQCILALLLFLAVYMF